jgi:hypothetical protein
LTAIAAGIIPPPNSKTQPLTTSEESQRVWAWRKDAEEKTCKRATKATTTKRYTIHASYIVKDVVRYETIVNFTT